LSGRFTAAGMGTEEGAAQRALRSVPAELEARFARGSIKRAIKCRIGKRVPPLGPLFRRGSRMRGLASFP